MKDDARSAEIPVRENKRGNEGPKVKPEAQPAGTHLHPNSWHSALHDLGVGFWSVGGHRGKSSNLVYTNSTYHMFGNSSTLPLHTWIGHKRKKKQRYSGGGWGSSKPRWFKRLTFNLCWKNEELSGELVCPLVVRLEGVRTLNRHINIETCFILCFVFYL